MKTVRWISILACLVIALFVVCLAVTNFATDKVTSDNTTTGNTAVAPTTTIEPEPVPADNITLSTEFPKLEMVATGSFQFNITLDYKGARQRVFDLKASVPAGWDVYIQPQYEAGKRISSVTIDSSFSGMSKQVTLIATTPTSPAPDAGDYKILMQATSGNVTGSLELVAKITAKYALTAIPVNQLVNTSAQAGKDNIYSIELSNTGSATLTNLTFTSIHPDGWEIKFSPDKLDALKNTDTKTIDVNIKPPGKTVSGDYMISLQISGKEATASKMDIRVTVNTPTIWGWVAVIIIVIVVVALFAVFMRFGRR
jgi:uncharacterized membrane protein